MKIFSSKVTDPKDKKKKKENTNTGDWTKRETPKRGFGSEGATGYSAVAPTVGGKAPKASGLKGANKKQVKAAKSMVRKGTGSGASKAAKLSRLRAYKRK